MTSNDALGEISNVSQPPSGRHTGVMTLPLAPGDQASRFALNDHYGAAISLHEVLARSHAALVFFPFAYSGICTGELQEIRDDLGAFQGQGVEVFAISCDPMYALRAWADAHGYFFPLLSDFWPHGTASRAYGVFDESSGCARRGTFLVERGGTIRHAQVGELGVRRDFSELRTAIAELRAAGPA